MTELRGVGQKHADALENAFDITSVLDLLMHYPRRYIDRTNEARVADLRVGEEAMVLVRVSHITSRRTRGRPPKTLVTADVTDGSGRLQLTFFNQPWRTRQLPAGTQCVVFGKPERFRGRLQMTNPVVDLVGDRTGRIVPVYPQSEKERLTTWDISRWEAEVIERAGEFAEPVPEAILDRFDFIDRTSAFTSIHEPESIGEAQIARRRLVFDELLRVQLALVLRKRALERTSQGFEHWVGAFGPSDDAGDGGRTAMDAVDRPDLVARFAERLPFELTGAQRRAIREIATDLAAPHPMHRLLQGDVGSGKTVVAVSALLVAVQNGHQGALMAPTEVLAQQHHMGVRALLDGFTIGDGGASLFGERPLRIELLTSRSTSSERKRILGDLESGEVDVVVGTHALIQEHVAFRSLGVVVIDEQHRFGVEQRAALRDKSSAGRTPDVLVMTATPIPRTAAMTVYGDLDLSVLDESPPGRTPITTHWVRTSAGVGADSLLSDDAEAGVWDHVRGEVAARRQAYVVCPLIEESENLEARSAEQIFEQLSSVELSGLRLGLLHGRLSAADKEMVMDLFRRGAIDVLVSTTVVEVGVDVPNATVMVVLDADRFGIAQLHQLRGRVGRGGDQSHCYLVGAGATPEAEERLAAMVRTTDGFELAEVDLELRGEGTLMGERQKGRNDLKLASLRRDREWVARARELAFELVDADPDLEGHPLLADEVALFLGDDAADFLLKS